ncbi:P-loop containing nucleoside triphosphate hydrolase protein [Chaetomium tenue]|uniref:P-loop containing nucleoside triphosphate hydrolase protein n=1 Tax=Chaetomium tenue TaxID=1854479 RepID=A0ACB7PAU3_9PEZI|nr:P-loop containing nucleoside triphosphate hydrolase protein [Chaetomium globosum]
MDSEQLPIAEKRLLNAPVETLSWSGLTVTVKEGKTGQPKTLVDNVEGIMQAGECCAVMGPSGCGKTTFLNVLAQRPIKAAHITGQVLVNGAELPINVFRHVTSFAQDHDIFIGALNVRETLHFASRLVGIPRGGEAEARIDTLLESFGLVGLATLRVGTGISHGQKRRLTVAKQLVTGPGILFLDEPTSGLDSVASCHVVSYLKQLAKRTGLIVVCSIHQPSTSTFNLFDKLLLLSAGKPHYFGPISQLVDYYASIGVTVPERANPADFLLELVNTDFSQAQNEAAASERERVAELASRWDSSVFRQQVAAAVTASVKPALGLAPLGAGSKPPFLARLAVLTHRSFIKSYRDGLAYTLRLAMYAALGLLAGTVWLQMDRDQDSIQLLTNALLVSCGFMSFMAVTYVPAFIEDYRQFRLDHRNGLYGPGSFLLSNFIVGIPYLFLFSAAFSVLFYWLGGCRQSAGTFFTWVSWLYLDLLAAEGIVILSVSIIPNFVGALVVTALLNVIAFATAGTLVPPAQLNAFYKYAFYYWNSQGYVFQGMMVTQFAGETYSCGTGCQCRYASLPDQCHIAGETVLDQYGVSTADQGRNVGIVLSIILGYRLAAWALLKMRR